uniref:Uncharacterized protein n=1 Tax=Biomphalaria glabrata TaxID=6526 RepID=A0A2C9LFM9_BIOGL
MSVSSFICLVLFVSAAWARPHVVKREAAENGIQAPQKLARSSTNLVEDTTAPKQDTTAPKQDTTAPKQDTTAPKQESVAPTQELTTPSQDSPVSTSQPAVLQTEDKGG